MKLMVASYNNGTPGWNGEAEETKLRSYTIDHKFNAPAECIIKLADVDGSLMRKYNTDANDVYLGVGKITLEDPNNTDIFYGRIIRAVGDSTNRTLTLECRDWLDQLDEELITYDMREKLGTSDMRQSMGRSDPDGTLFAATVDVASKSIYSAQADDGGVFTDETIAANNITDDDMTLLPALPVANDAYYFGFETKQSGFSLYISQQGDWVGTVVWTYWDGGAWAGLSGGPSGADSTFESAGQVDYSWTVPGDWATTAVNGVTAYYVRCEVNSFTGITTQPLGRNAWEAYYFFDDGEYDGGMAFANDQHNGQNLVFTTGMAGSRTWGVGPYADNVTWHSAEYNEAGSYADVWVDDSNSHDTDDADAAFEVDYSFRVYLGDDAPSVFYEDGSISAAKIHLVVYAYRAAGSPFPLNIKVGGVYKEIAQIKNDLSRQSVEFEVPGEYVSDIIDADGIAQIQIEMSSAAHLELYYVRLEIDCETTGYSTAITINDTFNPNRLEIATDLTAAATRVWEEIPYCIARTIPKHIDSDTGTIITDGDGIVILTCDVTIEATTGISTRQYTDRTRLQILQDLAQQDKSVFWITLGGTTVTYKQTFGADTMQLTDGKVDSWQSSQDYGTLVNSYDVYGARIGDYQIYQQSQTAASITKFLATRSKVIKNTGLVSDADAKAIGTALVARDNEVQQMVGCTISGNTATAAHATTIKLGEIVEITSSYLWSTAAKDYIVTRFVYDSEQHKTSLTLHPKVDIGLQPIVTLDSQSKMIQEQADMSQKDTYVPEPVTHEVV